MECGVVGEGWRSEMVEGCNDGEITGYVEACEI